MGVSPTGEIGLLAETADGLCARVYSSALAPLDSIALTVLDAGAPWDGGVAICSRGLKEVTGSHDWVVHAARSGVVVGCPPL